MQSSAEAAGGLRLIEDGPQRGRSRAAELKVQEGGRAEHVGVALERGDLAAGNDQQVVVIGRDLPQGAELGGGVVVGHRDEVEAASDGGFRGLERRTGDLRPSPGKARSVGMARVHVQVPPPPALALDQRRFRKSREGFALAVQPDLGFVARLGVRADVGRAQHQLPGSGADRRGQVGRRRLGFGQGEAALVPAAPAAEPFGIAQAQVDDRALLLAGIGEFHRDPLDACRNAERNFRIGLMCPPGQDAGQHQVRRTDLGPRRQGAQGEDQEGEEPCPRPPEAGRQPRWIVRHGVQPASVSPSRSRR
jgi:hypothetical protein